MIRHEILAGPSKWDLMLAVFDSSSKKRIIMFQLKDCIIKTSVEGLTVSALMISIKKIEIIESDMWRITGQHNSNDEKIPGNIIIEYSTHTRKGWMETTKSKKSPGQWFFECDTRSICGENKKFTLNAISEEMAYEDALKIWPQFSEHNSNPRIILEIPITIEC